jgi:hypothetical protein
MSNVGARKAREAKKQKQKGGNAPPPAPPAAPQFVFCPRCKLPHEAGTKRCEKCRGAVFFPMDNTQGMTLASLRRMAASIERTSGRTAMNVKRWVNALHLYTLNLRDPNEEIPDEEVNMFWIKLHGVVAEIPEQLADSIFAMTQEEARKWPDPKVPQYAAAHASATDAVESILTSITRDQHIYAEWRRHAECHLKQSAFTVQAVGKIGEIRKLKGQSMIKGLTAEGPIQVEELNEAITRALAAHGGDELPLARAIANQIGEAVEQLAFAWDRFP